jgi:hypothetical protein
MMESVEVYEIGGKSKTIRYRREMEVDERTFKILLRAEGNPVEAEFMEVNQLGHDAINEELRMLMTYSGRV